MVVVLLFPLDVVFSSQVNVVGFYMVGWSTISLLLLVLLFSLHLRWKQRYVGMIKTSLELDFGS